MEKRKSPEPCKGLDSKTELVFLGKRDVICRALWDRYLKAILQVLGSTGGCSSKEECHSSEGRQESSSEPAPQAVMSAAPTALSSPVDPAEATAWGRLHYATL